MRNTFVRVLALAAAITLSSLAALTTPRDADATATRAQTIARIDDLRRQTWRLQTLMGRPRTPTFYGERYTPDAAYRSWILGLWKRRAATALRQAQNPPRRGAWMCIHRYERHPLQGWRTNTGNGFYGGLQMNLAFQRTYGPELLRRKGTADNWTPYEQMWVADRAYRSGRGFYPWPNTARYCGLI